MTRLTLYNADYLSDAELRAHDWGALGTNVRIHATCVINGTDRVHIGDNVRIDPFCVISVASRLTIGSFVHVASSCSIVGAGDILFGDFNELSHGVRIFSSSSDYGGTSLTNPMLPMELRHVDTRPVTLGPHVIIGANAVVLPGVSVGDGATVGALSLVNRDLEPWTVNVGIPARRIRDREREPERLQRELLARLQAKDANEG